MIGLKKSKNTEKILLAVDGSQTARNTATSTIHIAHLLNFDILGLYVIDEELVTNDYADYSKELGSAEPSLSRADRALLFEKRGNEVLRNLESQGKESGVGMMTEIGIGGVWEITRKQAQEVSILALGRRGNGHPNKAGYLGTNFRQIAHHIHTSLLVGGDKSPRIKRLLLAYNGGERAQKALIWAKKFQDNESLDLMTLIVQEDNGPDSTKNWLEDIKSQLSQTPIKDLHLMIRKGDPANQIAEVAMETKSDLIIMGQHRHKALLEWVEGSTLDTILCKTSLPVLIA